MTPAERVAIIEREVGTTLSALVAEAARLASSRATFPAKAEGFLDIAERLGRAITPHTPCVKGCSHCCHMATAVSGFEAAMIGRYTGRVPVAQRREGIAEANAQGALLERFTGVPCTFLEAGRCNIYPVRPIACRVHHSMNDDETDCRIDPTNPDPPKVPRLNLNAFTMLQALAFLPDDYGDIREFFPPG